MRCAAEAAPRHAEFYASRAPLTPPPPLPHAPATRRHFTAAFHEFSPDALMLAFTTRRRLPARRSPKTSRCPRRGHILPFAHFVITYSPTSPPCSGASRETPSPPAPSCADRAAFIFCRDGLISPPILACCAFFFLSLFSRQMRRRHRLTSHQPSALLLSAASRRRHHAATVVCRRPAI